MADADGERRATMSQEDVEMENLKASQNRVAALLHNLDDENEEGILYQLSLISINNKTEIVVLNENGELQTEGDVINILTTIKNLYNKVL